MGWGVATKIWSVRKEAQEKIERWLTQQAVFLGSELVTRSTGAQFAGQCPPKMKLKGFLAQASEFMYYTCMVLSTDRFA